MTFIIAGEVNSKPSSKKMHSSKEQLQTVNDFKSETTNVKDTSSMLSTFSETSRFDTEENIWKKGELNMTYVVAGVGFVVSVLLILIVIQLCRKPWYAKRALTKKLTVSKLDDELTNQTHFNNNQKYMKSSFPQQRNHLYLDPVYYELDDCAAPMEIPTNSNAMTNTECKTDPLKLSYLNSRETKKQSILNINFVECCKQEHII